MNTNQPKIKAKKEVFKRDDYASFMIGVFVLGGLLVVPVFWGYVFGLRHIDSDNYYFGILPISLALCVSVLIAFKKNGTSSPFRIIVALIIGLLVSTILAAASGVRSYNSNTVFSFVILLLCGHLGTILNNLNRRLRKLQ